MLEDKKKEAETFVSDLITRALMICGSLMAVANGLIPSLGAMIYGKLTDELVIRNNSNCSLNESVTTITLTNITKLDVMYPRITGIVINETRSIEVLLNGSHVQVTVVGLGGTTLKETMTEKWNGRPIRLNGTSFNGANLTRIDVKGTRVKMVALKGQNISGEEEGKPRVKEKENNASINKTNKHGEGGDKTNINETRAKGKEGGNNEINGGNTEKATEGKNTATWKDNENENQKIEKGRVGWKTKRGEGEHGNENSNIEKTEECEDSNEIKAFEKERFDNERKTLITESRNKANRANRPTDGSKNEEVIKTAHYKNIRKREVYQKVTEVAEPSQVSVTGDSEKENHSAIAKSPNMGEFETPENESNTNVTRPNARGSANVTDANSTKNTSHTKMIPPETSNIDYTVRNITEDCRSIEIRIEENMAKYAMYYVYAAIGTLVFAYGQMIFWNIASEMGVKNMSENITDSVMDKEPGYFDTKAYEGAMSFDAATLSSDPLEAVGQSELDALSGGLGGEIAYLIQSISSAASGFIVSFIQNWKITLVMMTAAPVLGMVQGIATKVETFVNARKEEIMNRASSMAKKSLGSVKTVASFAGEKIEKTRFSGKVEASNNLGKIKSMILAAKKGVSTLIIFGFLGLGFWYSSSLLPGGSVTPGALMTIFMAIIAGVMQVSGTGEQVDDIGQAKTALMSLFGGSEQESDDPFDLVANQLEKVLGKLDVFNVYFHYPARPEYQVLKSINFTVEEGQTVALLGDKGCGKSTLIKLLQRIYDPQIGRVRLDGHDVRYLDRRWFRRQVGIVHKKPEFFSTSIAENIAYGKQGCTLKQIIQAAKESGAHDFIVALPQGYATVLSDDGSPLTPYQKHLLALARAMIRNPRILLWEEDLSIMDQSSLNVLTSYLDQSRHGRTTVISTSHVSVARIADVIILLHNGEIIEEGTPEELYQSGGAFTYLSTLQYFESQTIHRESLLKTAPVSSSLPPVDEGVEALESAFTGSQEQTKDQVKGFISQIRQTIKDKLNEGEGAYKMIRMQLQDLPLLLAGALGAAITGMVAPGLAFLFGEIQKVLNDSERVAREGVFWASMFLVLGAVVGFGGTIESFMLGYAGEKLRSRLQKMAFDAAIDKNSVPQMPGIPSMPTFPGAGGQLPGVPGIGVPTLPGLPTGTGLPTAPGLTPGTGLPAVPGLPTGTGLPTVPGLPTGTGLPITPGLPTGTGLPTVPGLPTETGLPTAPGLPSETGLPTVPGGLAGDLTGVLSQPSGLIPPALRPHDQSTDAFGVPMADTPGLPGIASPDVPGVSGAQLPELDASQLDGAALGATDVPGFPGATGAAPGLAPYSAGVGPGGMVPGSSGLPLADPSQMQDMGLVPNVPNPNLLPIPDPQKQAEQMMEQVEKDVEAALQNSIGKYLGTQVQETISSVSTLGMAFYNGWKMTLVVLAGLPIIGLANSMQGNETEASTEPEGVEALMSTSFKKMETITALGAESEFTKKYKAAIMDKYKHALKKIIASGFAFALGQAMVFFIYAGALRFGCYLISVGDMSAIQVLGVLMTVLFGSMATTSSRAPSHASGHAEESMDRLFDDEAANVEDQLGDKLDDIKGNLDFNHVELPDPLNKGGSLLSQLNVKVSGGQTLALVPLDNEKMNPLELLVERFYDPVRGRLLLDEKDIRSLDLSWLRSQQAVVSHSSFLPHCTIAENIAYGDNKREVSRREVEDMAYSAFAHEFIVGLPKGYDTVPDEEHITLTNSQKQRIAIARALLRSPPIVIIEELEESDEAVNDATQILSRNRTCLVVTRRRATVEAADQVVLVYRGHVIEQGTLEELRDLRRLYYLLSNLEGVEEL